MRRLKWSECNGVYGYPVTLPMIKNSRRIIGSLLAATLASSIFLQAAEEDEVSFNFDIRPIMSDTCFLCHGPDAAAREAELRLDLRAEAIADRDGSPAIIPGDPDESLIIWMINAEDEEDIMPPPSHPRSLTAEEKELFYKWIEQGAKYEQHWAFNPPAVELEVDAATHPIDVFVAESLAQENRELAEEADKTTLIRRVTFDLTGLPPTLEEIDAFLANDRPDAYERLVDGLLSRVSYAERMTNEWMDVARFADSHGYSQDFIRDMSPYRDWVIEAFDQNMPFDQFVEWQLAGDLLPNATRTQKLATGFNRLHPQNMEGGIVNEEFRVEYVADRVQTLGAAFMGITMECSRCHDHKYDPISQENYYELFSFFNNIEDSGQISFEPTDMPVPTLLLPKVEEEQELGRLDKLIDQQVRAVKRLEASEKQTYEKWLSSSPKDNCDLSGEDALVAHMPLGPGDSKAAIANLVDPEATGRVLIGAALNGTDGPELVLVDYEGGTGVEVNGDDPLYFPGVNFFRRAKPFSVSIETRLGNDSEDGTLFHFNKAGILYNYKGFEVSLLDGHWDVRMAHSFPYNSIQLISEEPAILEAWQHVMLTYDGSSKASGLTLYVNGEPVPIKVERDRLYKNILSNKEGVQKEIALKVGARWRSKGLPGALVDDVRAFDRRLTGTEVAHLAGLEGANVDYEFYLNRYHEDYKSALVKLAELRQERNSLNEGIQEVMVMDEMPTPRQAYILDRGAYDNYGTPVVPDSPEAILTFDDNLPRNRLGLAKWLMDPQNPLTARVTVNRYWQIFFGHGIVGTPEDFGNQGHLPSHPELLDWLAKNFIESDWDVKGTMKLMATSATYRQSSKGTASLLKDDPDNMLLARGPSARLSAEMLRDNALAASGLLVRKVGGKSVYPYQPEGLWSMNKGTYEEGIGDDLYRRSLYTVWKRTAPPPTMNNFDAPDRSYCVVKRQQTDTPLQALSLMNDPQFVEASRALAERVLIMSEDPDEQLKLAYRLLTSRYPSEAELALLAQLYDSLTDSFSKKQENAEALLTVGQRPVNAVLSTDRLAALSSVSSLIMNHDASVVKR